MAEQESRDRDGARDPRAEGRSGASAPRGDRKPPAKREGDRKPYAKRDGDKPYAKRDGERRPYGQRDDRKPYGKRDDDRRSYGQRDGERKPYVKRDGDKPYAKRDGDKPYAKRDGERRPYGQRDERKPYVKRDGDKPYQRDGERKPYQRDDRKPYQRDGERKPYQRDGERKPYAKRDGDKPYAKRDGDRKPYARRDGDDRRSPRPTRGGADRPDRAVREGEIRPVRPRHDDPVIPEEITPRDLNAAARNELKTLSKENADQVARHLAMASQLIDEDPELAHQHALSASRRAGRIAVVRETLAITAYAIGDYALALRELRTYRRISGRDDQIALMVDSERGIGRPDRALETGRAVDRSTLPTAVRVELAIAMSGARLDLGEPERALVELDIPELDPDRAFEWSPALFAARATVLEELGRDEEAAQWRRRAIVAAEALDAASNVDDFETIFVEEVIEEHDEPEATTVAEGEDSEESTEATELAADTAEPEPEPAVESTPAEPSIEDEVTEILTEAGIEDAEDDTDEVER